MTTTIEAIVAKINTSTEWTITTICPQHGAIIVINNAYTDPIFSYRLGSNGLYKLDKNLSYSESAKSPLLAMIAAHNASDENQKEAENFEANMLAITE